jgi:hypothetical protein
MRVFIEEQLYEGSAPEILEQLILIFDKKLKGFL